MTVGGKAVQGPRLAGRVGVLAVGAVLLGALLPALPAPAAHAAGTVVVAPEPSADGPSTVTVSGSGFQYVPNAPGGIYVFFGVVSDPASTAWAPSQGGASGTTYSYASTEGAIRLVAFAGGSSATDANAVIDANGDWTAEMTIPGSTFIRSSGNPHDGSAAEGETVDCLQQVCGIITIGAHGNVNANNESFTPVVFAAEEEPVSAEEPSDGDPGAEEPADDEAVSAADEDQADSEGGGLSAGVLWAIIAGAVVLVAAAAVWAGVAARRSAAAKREGGAGGSSSPEEAGSAEGSGIAEGSAPPGQPGPAEKTEE